MGGSVLEGLLVMGWFTLDLKISIHLGGTSWSSSIPFGRECGVYELCKYVINVEVIRKKLENVITPK